jgi:hypothetical protein
VTESHSSSGYSATAVWGMDLGGVQFAGSCGPTIDVHGNVYSSSKLSEGLQSAPHGTPASSARGQ